MKDEQVNETSKVNAELTQDAASPKTPAPLVVQITRSGMDWVLAVIQLVTLIAVMAYVILTWQIASATKTATESAVRTTKADIAVTLVNQLYSDQTVQDTLELIFNHDIEFKNEKGEPVIVSGHDLKKDNLEPKVSMMLNRFQILGHLYNLKILQNQDLIGLRYEIIEIGRNKAVRDYFDFLNHDYQKSSGIVHDHFKNFKDVYLAFEYDPSQRQQFQKYLFHYPPGTSPADE